MALYRRHSQPQAPSGGQDGSAPPQPRRSLAQALQRRIGVASAAAPHARAAATAQEGGRAVTAAEEQGWAEGARLSAAHYQELEERFGVVVQKVLRCVEQYGLHDVVLP